MYEGHFFFSSLFLHRVPPLHTHTHTHTHTLLSPCSFRLAHTKEARLSQCALSFSPAHFISSLHSLPLLESTHVHTTHVCACVPVCFMEFVMAVAGVYVCWGSYRPRGQGSEVLLWKRLWAVRSATGDSAEGLFVSALRDRRRSLPCLCACVHVSHKYSCLCRKQLSAIGLNQLQ